MNRLGFDTVVVASGHPERPHGSTEQQPLKPFVAQAYKGARAGQSALALTKKDESEVGRASAVLMSMETARRTVAKMCILGAWEAIRELPSWSVSGD